MEMKAKVHTATAALTVEPRIAVVGIGGAGCNVVNDLYWADGSMDIIAINTDKISLKETNADKKVRLCKDVTKGEGAKGDTLLGQRCAEAHKDDIREALEGYDTVIMIAGMGGGTGTGVAPVVASVAHSMGLITIAVVIRPFSFETQRMRAAKEGIAKISAMCPATVVVENDRIAAAMPDATMEDAFRTVNMSVAKFVTEKKRTLTEAMTDQVSSLEAMIEDAGEHPLSVYSAKTLA